MRVILIITSLILLFFIDLRLLYKAKSHAVVVTYSLLMLLGFIVLVIVAMDLPVAAPTIFIERIVKLIIAR